MANFNINWNAVSGGAPYMTISALSIAFNSTSISKLGTPEQVIIGFDEDNLILAIQPYLSQEYIKPYEFATKIKNDWVRIGCKDFVAYLSSISGIEFDTAKRYILQRDNDNDLLYAPIRDYIKKNERKIIDEPTQDDDEIT